ncbi:hypothetical protein GCM10017608_10960 [Agromyces luteolus]|uniref:VOC domain-containing protein n=1 Tax=Agromyces luteolus TaxID=88373 RepID=A0A7C9HJJ9_9MICO|nr:VOC family protein [Agromyces luteolus]MUN08623.1 hypothetical protein [Agromyces luteolus]GLK27163.1 hypothetical protein GCM10017608_10960 [Agromyces luteolus]
MGIQSIVIRVADIDRSLDFYAGLLGGEPIGVADGERATLDFVTGTVELVRFENGTESVWVEDDLYRGFRHVGFVVADIGRYVEEVARRGIRVRFGPMDLGTGMHIFFVFDPDGTVVELVQGDVTYTEVFDVELVEAARALGAAERPRLDHIGHTVDSLEASVDYYAALGFGNAGKLVAPGDPRGMRMDYLRGGDTVIELFSWSVPTAANPPRPGSYGFAAAVVDGSPTGERIGSLGDGRTVLADPDGLPLIAGS